MPRTPRPSFAALAGAILALCLDTPPVHADCIDVPARTVPNDHPLDLDYDLAEHPSFIPLAYPGPLRVFNVYWSDHWNAVPGHASMTREQIDEATRELVDSAYFDKLCQYDVPDLVWGGSEDTDHLALTCPKNPGAEQSVTAAAEFITCMVADQAASHVPGWWDLPVVGARPGLCALPYPTNPADLTSCALMQNPTGIYIFNIIVPKGARFKDGSFESCVPGGYAAFHFQVPSAPHFGFVPSFGFQPGPIPFTWGFPIYFTVIPAECFTDTADLIGAMTHEVAETATDPWPLFHWIDLSTANPFLTVDDVANIPSLLKDGELADICETPCRPGVASCGDVGFKLPSGAVVEVATLWSNVDNACLPGGLGHGALSCGDGIVDPGEACDDGNLADGDCCVDYCRVQVAAGASCDDGNACTQADTCDAAGQCVGANPVVCPPGDQCLEDGTCDPATGLCSNAPKPDGLACNDGDPCTHTDACQAGACVGDVQGADTDADGYCDFVEAMSGCSPTDAAEIPPQATTNPGPPTGIGNVLMTATNLATRRITVASDPSCAAAGACGPHGLCTTGRMMDPCSADADCDQPAGVCRLVVTYANVPDLQIASATIKRQPVSGFTPATPGCARKIDVPLHPTSRVTNLRVKLTGTVDGRSRRQLNAIRYRR